MSGLSYLCGYGSNSDDSDCEYVRPENGRPKLPAPDLSKVPIVAAEEHLDDLELHEGRARSFPHVRGNWATFVFVKVSTEELEPLVSKLKEHVLSIDDSCQTCEDYHISLSRTVVLKYHQITPLTTSLRTELYGIGSFDLGVCSVKLYTNEEQTRTFIALQLDPVGHKHLLQLSQKVDEILSDFSLPPFYKDASFHISVLWINGDKKKELSAIIDKLNDIVNQEVGNSIDSFNIHQVNCKSGNKLFQFSL